MNIAVRKRRMTREQFFDLALHDSGVAV